MDCSANINHFLAVNSRIPSNISKTLKFGTNDEFLDRLAIYAADPKWTLHILCSFERLLPELCARWPRLLDASSTVAACGRIIDATPWMSEQLLAILTALDLSVIVGDQKGLAADATDTDCINSEQLSSALMGLFRLLSFDNDTFSTIITPANICLLTRHESHCVRYIAIRLLSLYLHLSDAAETALILKHVGENSTQGSLDDEHCDLSFLTLYEMERKRKWASSMGISRSEDYLYSSHAFKVRCLTAADLSTGVIEAFGTLVFQDTVSSLNETMDSSLCPTSTTVQNGRTLLDALRSPKPTLVAGVAGCGKSMLINSIASRVKSAKPLITLHMNEQTDAKSLVGIHVTGEEPGTFEWQPGVLTKAMQDGRSILIEDLDRVPKDIMGMLLPVLKRREIRLPGKDRVLKAATGFRLLATLQTASSKPDGNSQSIKRVMASHFWNTIKFTSLPDSELCEIVKSQFQLPSSMVKDIMEAFSAMVTTSVKLVSKGTRNRLLTPRDLFKWCARISAGLSDKQRNSKGGSIDYSTYDGIFLDAMDCFSGSVPDSSQEKTLHASQLAAALQLSADRRDFLLSSRSARFERLQGTLVVGRCQLSSISVHQATPSHQTSQVFSLCRHTRRVMEQVAVAVSNREPLLLVGPTGIGKTSALSYLADTLNQKLTVINLSQQSESGDLLGSFKPVTVRSFVIPLQAEFDALFSKLFSQSKRGEYSAKLSKMISKGKWKELIKFWRQVLSVAEKAHGKDIRSFSTVADDKPGLSSKRRKLNQRQSWDGLAQKLDAFETRLAGNAESFAFKFVEGALVKAVREGGWVLLDEINLAAPDTLECLSELLDDGHQVPSIQLTESGNTERVKASPHFRIFGAMNPSGDFGKRELPPAIRSRFTEIFVESPDNDKESLEHIVATYLFQSSPRYVNRFLSPLISYTICLESDGYSIRNEVSRQELARFAQRRQSIAQCMEPMHWPSMADI